MVIILKFIDKKVDKFILLVLCDRQHLLHCICLNVRLLILRRKTVGLSRIGGTLALHTLLQEKANKRDRNKAMCFVQLKPTRYQVCYSQSPHVKRINNPRIKPLGHIVPLCGSYSPRRFAMHQGDLICTMCILL